MRRSLARSALYPICLLFLGLPPAQAQEASETDLRKDVQNPVATLTAVGFINRFAFDTTGPLGSSYTLQSQIITPFHAGGQLLLVPEIILSDRLHQSDSARSTQGVTGFSDTTLKLFFSGAPIGRVIWAAGFNAIAPTAAHSTTGQGKWGLGPAIGLFVQPRWGTVGFTVENTWSVAGDANRASVNLMALQLVANYNLPKNWYLTSQPEIDANWHATRGDRWSVPVGGGVGRVFRAGAQPMAATLVAYRFVVFPEAVSAPRWLVKASLSFLFPSGL